MIYSDRKLVNVNWGQDNYSKLVDQCVLKIYELNGGTGLNLSLQDYKAKSSEAADYVWKHFFSYWQDLDLAVIPTSGGRKALEHADELNAKILSELKDNLILFGEQMHKISQHKTDKTQVVSGGNVDSNATFDMEGYLVTRPDGTASAKFYKDVTGEDPVNGSSDSSTSGSGLGTIAIVAGLALVLILVLKKK